MNIRDVSGEEGDYNVAQLKATIRNLISELKKIKKNKYGEYGFDDLEKMLSIYKQLYKHFYNLDSVSNDGKEYDKDWLECETNLEKFENEINKRKNQKVENKKDAEDPSWNEFRKDETESEKDKKLDDDEYDER